MEYKRNVVWTKTKLKDKLKEIRIFFPLSTSLKQAYKITDTNTGRISIRAYKIKQQRNNETETWQGFKRTLDSNQRKRVEIISCQENKLQA